MKSPLQPKPQRGGGEKEQGNVGPKVRWYRDRQDGACGFTNEWVFLDRPPWPRGVKSPIVP